jgi:hypothetical protein
MALYRILEATRARNTTVGNPMFNFVLVDVITGVSFACRNEPNSGFIYGLQTHGTIDGQIRTTPSGRVYLTDASNVRVYDLVAINERTGRKDVLTRYPMLLSFVETMRSKQSAPHKDVRFSIEESR